MKKIYADAIRGLIVLAAIVAIVLPISLNALDGMRMTAEGKTFCESNGTKFDTQGSIWNSPNYCYDNQQVKEIVYVKNEWRWLK